MLAIQVPCASCGLHHHTGAPCPVSLVLRDEQDTLPAGTCVAGRYRVQDTLHRGSMSTVYRVSDTVKGGELVVLKELVLSGLSPEERAEMLGWFLREAHLLSALRHPALPRLHASFCFDDRQYLVMNEIPGESLEALARGGPLPEEQVVRWGIGLCEVLHFLHTLPEPVVYRDLKPANVVVRSDTRTVVLVDFGVARQLPPGVAGTAVGTPGYAAPEQYQGLADARSDIYALGATLHRVLTGYDPERDSAFRQPPVRDLRPEISASVASAIDRALSIDPAARYADVEEMWRDLRAAVPPGAEAVQAVTRTFYRTTLALPVVTMPLALTLLANQATILGGAVPGPLLACTPMLLYAIPLLDLRRRAERVPSLQVQRASRVAGGALLVRVGAMAGCWWAAAIPSTGYATAWVSLLFWSVAFFCWCVGLWCAAEQQRAVLP